MKIYTFAFKTTLKQSRFMLMNQELTPMNMHMEPIIIQIGSVKMPLVKIQVFVMIFPPAMIQSQDSIVKLYAQQKHVTLTQHTHIRIHTLTGQNMMLHTPEKILIRSAA